jgi:dipeptidyl aminopeptidase/acylaminoacyl peptidase
MTTFERFEREIPELMTELAPARLPDYFDDMLGQTARMRQRPAWSSLERWLPMGVLARPMPVRPMPWRTIGVLLILAALLLGASLLYVGSRQPRVPAPFGPAANGALFFTSPDGKAFRLESIDATPQPIDTGEGFDTGVSPSRDGRRIAILRGTAGDTRIVVANQDGSEARDLAGSYSELAEMDWSPDGRQIAVISTVDGLPSISILETDGSGARALPLGLEAHDLWYRPNGQLVFRGNSPSEVGRTFAPYLVNADGKALRPIVPPTTQENDVIAMTISPDGKSIAYHVWRDPDEHGHLYVTDIDTGDSHRVRPARDSGDQEYEGAQFSPDGSTLLFSSFSSCCRTLSVAPAAGGPVIDIGTNLTGDGGPTADAIFSPDGTSILAFYPESGELWMLDPTGKTPGRRIELDLAGTPTWQRRAT